MKSHCISLRLPILAVALGAGALASGQAAPVSHHAGEPPRVLSHADLAKKRNARGAPVPSIRPINRNDLGHVQVEDSEAGSGKRDPKRPGTDSLIARSAIISHNGKWTIVPKGSVLHVPPLFAKRVNCEPGKDLLVWKDFIGVNRGWIRTVEVTVPQARGDKEIAEATLKAVETASQVVISVCKGGPISVNPFRGEEEATPVRTP